MSETYIGSDGREYEDSEARAENEYQRIFAERPEPPNDLAHVLLVSTGWVFIGYDRGFPQYRRES